MKNKKPLKRFFNRIFAKYFRRRAFKNETRELGIDKLFSYRKGTGKAIAVLKREVFIAANTDGQSGYVHLPFGWKSKRKMNTETVSVCDEITFSEMSICFYSVKDQEDKQTLKIVKDKNHVDIYVNDELVNSMEYTDIT